MKSTKDRIIMGIRIIVGIALLGYIAYLFINKEIVVQNSFVDYNIIVLGFIGLLALGIFLMGIWAIHIPKMRLMQFLAGIALILFANYILQDQPYNGIFLRDMINVLGAFWTIAGPTGLCVLDCVRQKVETSKMEIIEV